MKYLQTLILAILTTTAFGQDCKKFVTGQFVPVEQSTEDSIYYLITLSSFYELHSTKEYRNVFDLKWHDHCTFEMKFDDSSIKIDNQYKTDETFQCSANFINDSIIELKMNDKVKRLKRYREQSIWRLMMQRDNELKKLEEEKNKSLKKYEAMLEKGDSLSGMLGMMKGLSQSLDQGLKLSEFELEAISNLFINLKTFDSQSFYSIGSTELKKEIDSKTFEQYFSYIKNVYGQWEYFSVLSQSMNSSLFGLPVTQSGIAKFSFKVKFKNCKDEVTLSLSLSEEKDKREPSDLGENAYTIIEGPKTFQSISVSSNEYESSNYLEKVSSNFFELFYKKKYTKIYQGCSDILKSEASDEQIMNMLSLANSLSDGSKYKIYKHVFTMNQQYDGLITIHYVAETDARNIYLSLTYLSDPVNHELVGLNIKEIKKK